MLQFLAEGFSADEVYRDVIAERRPADAPDELSQTLAAIIANRAGRITLDAEPVPSSGSGVMIARTPGRIRQGIANARSGVRASH